ncbi:MAG: hypothetical protein RLZ98_1382 [Pseudomonadota bacterium]|jgi:N-acetylmuramoyl-L-alanine amidase
MAKIRLSTVSVGEIWVLRQTFKAIFGDAATRCRFRCVLLTAAAGAALAIVSTAEPGLGQERLRGAAMPPGHGHDIVNDHVEIRDTGAAATMVLRFSSAVAANAFVLGSPYRVIVDLPPIDFRLPPNALGEGRGKLVRAFRYGRFAPGRSRVVLDLAGPAVIDNVKVEDAGRGRRRMVFSIKGMGKAQFAALEAAGLIGPPRGSEKTGETARRKLGRRTEKRPVVVIDPGHGGLDPGAVAGKGVTEKDVVLAVARRLRKALEKTGRYKVLLTRDGDEFVSLKDRQQFARENGGDLFISLHADALAEGTEDVSGATVYTLSNKASDEAAQRLAEKENAADLAAGLELGDSEQEDKVRGILFDLMQRETRAFSQDFRKILLKKLSGRVRLSKAPARSAAFAVLKQTETPSVLVELGYMSNGYDRGNLTSPKWQSTAATSLTAAVDAFFAKRNAAAGRAAAPR